MAGEALQRQVLRALGREGIKFVKPKIVAKPHDRPVKALQDALRAELRSDTHLAIVVPHYWALYVHDGRRAPVRAQRGGFLIWFKDPKDDPRLIGGVTPERASQLRHLSAGEFRRIMRERHQDLLDGRDPKVVVTTQVNKSTAGSYFFTKGMKEFNREANRVGQGIVRRSFFGTLRKALGLTKLIPHTPGAQGIVFPTRKETVTISLFGRA